jgi:hypothetical protein
MADSLSIDEMQATLTRVKRYREVCEVVRRGAGNTMFNGAMFLGLTYLNYTLLGNKFHLILLPMAIFGVLELLVGLWSKVKPSPECVLFDGLLMLGYCLSIVAREYISAQLRGGQIRFNPLTIVIIVWFGWSAISTIRSYFNLRSYFVERPTAEHLAYVDTLTDEILDANPASDSSAVEVPTNPTIKLKLLGPMAFVLDVTHNDLSLFAKQEVSLEQTGERVILTIRRDAFAPCAVDSNSLRNFTMWKASQS